MKQRVPQAGSETLRLILCIFKHGVMVKFVPVHAIKAQADVQLHSFLISLMDGWEWLTSRSGRFTLEDIIDDIHWLGWVPRPVWTIERLASGTLLHVPNTTWSFYAYGA